MKQEYVVIGRWRDVESRDLVLRDFVIDGESRIPLFSDEEAFKRQMAGSPYEREGLVIASALLLSILREQDLLILDPGRQRPQKLTKRELETVPDRAGDHWA